ncbi:MAG: NUDIX domain-containing protein [Acidobacteria bacterium]|nr:NUDIX domain-containing protein [Acidobacteriota bacterium]
MVEWPRVPYVGVGCLVIRDRRLLLIRRHGLHGAGSWSPPGGHLGFGETPAQCARRELYEETGVVVSEVTFVAITNDIFDAEDKHYITVWMRGIASAGEGTIQAPEEVAEIGWFDVDALPSPLFLCFANLVAGDCAPRLGPGEALR